MLNGVLLFPVSAIINAFFIYYFLKPVVGSDILIDMSSYSLWLQCIALLVIKDFILYARHRFMHRFMWSFHATHHSALELRSTVHFRLHPIDYFIAGLFDSAALYFIGFDAELLMNIGFAMAIYNMWLHVNVNLDYGFPLRYIIASPNYHKWHHAKALEAQDKNLVDLFPLWDYLGGTYYHPVHRLPDSYGVLGVNDKDTLHQSLSGAFLYPFRQAIRKIRNFRNASLK
jgi:sterol desaturase/sphingolipid hydroxylase (fatty acid hydroxylase superfamily)